jgi:hypothetical protein
MVMTDQQLTLQAICEVQSIFEEYSRPHSQKISELISEKLLAAVGQRPDLVAAAIRLQQRSNLEYFR